jgi:holo-[acyl-carrier protein] synthase
VNAGDGAADARIVGVGVDAVDVARFRKVLERSPRVATRCFTDEERSDASHSADVAQSLAARFAAKEAVMKAFGVGIGAFALTEVEVRRSAGTPGRASTRNAPSVELHGAAAALAAEQGAARVHLSLSHTDHVAIAFVVAEAAPGAHGPGDMGDTGDTGDTAEVQTCAPS